MAALLARIYARRADRNEIQHLLRDQPVVKYHLGLLQNLDRLQGQKLWIAGTGPDQVHQWLACIEMKLTACHQRLLPV
jgi:hypothetical protein